MPPDGDIAVQGTVEPAEAAQVGLGQLSQFNRIALRSTAKYRQIQVFDDFRDRTTGQHQPPGALRPTVSQCSSMPKNASGAKGLVAKSSIPAARQR